MPTRSTSAPASGVFAPLTAGLAGVRMPALGGVTDAELVALTRELGSVKRGVDALGAVLAGEIARRSSREAGYPGIAQRLGAASPEKLVASLTGIDGREARALVTVGRLEESSPMAESVRGGGLSVAQASAVAAGLGTPTDTITLAVLSDAAAALVAGAVDGAGADGTVRPTSASMNCALGLGRRVTPSMPPPWRVGRPSCGSGATCG